MMKDKCKLGERNPYANNAGGRIDAPNRPQNQPAASVIRGKEDLRK